MIFYTKILTLKTQISRSTWLYVNSHKTALFLKHIYFIDQIKLPQVRNSTTHLTIQFHQQLTPMRLAKVPSSQYSITMHRSPVLAHLNDS